MTALPQTTPQTAGPPRGIRAYLERVYWVDVVLNIFRIVIIALAVIGTVNTLLKGDYTLSQWLSLTISGLAQGSIYALIALGYSLVYGVLLMINFAHGEVYMAGAFTAYFVADWTAKNGMLEAYPVPSIALWFLVGAGVSLVIAVLLERIAYRPLRNAPRLVPLITAIGASFFLQYTFRGLYGSAFKSYPAVPQLSGTVEILGTPIPIVQFVVFFAALILMACLQWLVERTKMGKAMRSVSENKEVSALMGIDIDKVIVFTFAIGGALAGAAGVVNGLYRPQGVNFYMGFFPGIKAFTAAVLGGIGSVPGALLGGLFLGVIESVGPALILGGLGIPATNQLKDMIAFILLVLVLIFRPQGILGEKLADKKA